MSENENQNETKQAARPSTFTPFMATLKAAYEAHTTEVEALKQRETIRRAQELNEAQQAFINALARYMPGFPANGRIEIDEDANSIEYIGAGYSMTASLSGLFGRNPVVGSVTFMPYCKQVAEIEALLCEDAAIAFPYEVKSRVRRVYLDNGRDMRGIRAELYDAIMTATGNPDEVAAACDIALVEYRRSLEPVECESTDNDDTNNPEALQERAVIALEKIAAALERFNL